jgi:AcrR family transcriptional regulator
VIAGRGPPDRPREAPRRRLDPALRREELVRAAARHFAAAGFAGTMRDLAQACGVTAGLFYRYFASKEALIEAVFADMRGRWGSAQASVPDGPAPLAERLLGFYAAYLRRNSDYNGMRLFLHAALSGLDLPLRYGPDLDAWVLRPIAAALRAEAGLPPPADPLPRAERDLLIGLHGAVVFVGIRRHIYAAAIDEARHLELVGTVLRAMVPGALIELRRLQERLASP